MSSQSREFSLRQQSRLATIAATNASAQWLPGNANRTAITFSAHPTEPYTVGPNEPAVIGVGLNIPAASQAVTLTEAEHGDMLRMAWHVVTAVNPVTLACLETIVVNTSSIR